MRRPQSGFTRHEGQAAMRLHGLMVTVELKNLGPSLREAAQAHE